MITFESNRAFVLMRITGRPRLILQELTTSRITAIYRDFVAAIRTGTQPEMSLERAMEDQRLIDQIMATAQGTTTLAEAGSSRAVEIADFDLVIIGSGAGKVAMAHALASTGRRILVLERGGEVPSEPENWSPAAVWKDLRYRTAERWVDSAGDEFQPYMHYNVGGNTKYWGSVLYRLRREDFGEIAHRDGVSPAWPIWFNDLAPSYGIRRTSLPGARRPHCRPHRAAARALSAPSGPACQRPCRGDRRASSPGAAPLAVAARPRRSWPARRLPAVQYL